MPYCLSCCQHPCSCSMQPTKPTLKRERSNLYDTEEEMGISNGDQMLSYNELVDCIQEVIYKEQLHISLYQKYYLPTDSLLHPIRPREGWYIESSIHLYKTEPYP